MNYITPLRKELEAKFAEKKLSPSSIKLYVRNLEKLNDDQPLKTLTFLKDPAVIATKLEHYKENTKRGYLISIVSTLALDKSNKAKQALYDSYYKMMMDKNKALKAAESENKMSDAQASNWLKWTDVEEKWNALEQRVNTFIKQKEINESQYNTLLAWVVLSLYTLLPPRRNEYQMVQVVKSAAGLPTDTNYLDVDKSQFILHKFKTAKKEGVATIAIPEKLLEVIRIYFKYHPLIQGKKITKATHIPFLVYYDGKEMNQTNSVTRILNKIFGKKVSSSMLRHVYLSSKYGNTLEEMKQDSDAMGHSLATQKDYIKTE